jgi:hypothetical protein
VAHGDQTSFQWVGRTRSIDDAIFWLLKGKTVKNVESEMNHDALDHVLSKAGILPADLAQFRHAQGAGSAQAIKGLAKNVADPRQKAAARAAFENRALTSRIVFSSIGANALPVSAKHPNPGKPRPHSGEGDGPLPLPLPLPWNIPDHDHVLSGGAYFTDSFEVHGHGTGIDWGWGTHDFQEGGTTRTFSSTFTPPGTDIYEFRTGIVYVGLYALYSNDGAFNSYSVNASISAAMQVSQVLPAPMEFKPGMVLSGIEIAKEQEMWGYDSQNINKSGVVQGEQTFDIQTPLFANIPVSIDVTVWMAVYARGDHTTAILDFSESAGGIYCSGLLEARGRL